MFLKCAGTRISCALVLRPVDSLHSVGIYSACCFTWIHVSNHSHSPPTLPLSTFRQCIVTGGCLSCHGLMVGFPRFASKGAVFIYELAASSGRFWMSQAHNLHFMSDTYMHTFIYTTGNPNTLSAMKINVLFFTCVLASFLSRLKGI